jgi:aminoglycoside/choline kinase family phosphotransferase
MVTDPDNPGVLDFQDAVVGAVTYDLVSLLRDCYIAWPREQVETWALDHRARLRALGMGGLDDADLFLRGFDLMGAQRHLKAIGIFARLNLRDGKPGYLRDIPRTLSYVLDVADRYPELAELRDLLRARGVDRWRPAL